MNGPLARLVAASEVASFTTDRRRSTTAARAAASSAWLATLFSTRYAPYDSMASAFCHSSTSSLDR